MSDDDNEIESLLLGEEELGRIRRDRRRALDRERLADGSLNPMFVRLVRVDLGRLLGFTDQFVGDAQDEVINMLIAHRDALCTASEILEDLLSCVSDKTPDTFQYSNNGGKRIVTIGDLRWLRSIISTVDEWYEKSVAKELADARVDVG